MSASRQSRGRPRASHCNQASSGQRSLEAEEEQCDLITSYEQWLKDPQRFPVPEGITHDFQARYLHYTPPAPFVSASQPQVFTNSDAYLQENGTDAQATEPGMVYAQNNAGPVSPGFHSAWSASPAMYAELAHQQQMALQPPGAQESSPQPFDEASFVASQGHTADDNGEGPSRKRRSPSEEKEIMRERNRVAQQKCRERKAQELQDAKDELQHAKNELQDAKDETARLAEQVQHLLDQLKRVTEELERVHEELRRLRISCNCGKAKPK